MVIVVLAVSVWHRETPSTNEQSALSLLKFAPHNPPQDCISLDAMSVFTECSVRTPCARRPLWKCLEPAGSGSWCLQAPGSSSVNGCLTRVPFSGGW